MGMPMNSSAAVLQGQSMQLQGGGGNANNDGLNAAGIPLEHVYPGLGGYTSMSPYAPNIQQMYFTGQPNQ